MHIHLQGSRQCHASSAGFVHIEGYTTEGFVGKLGNTI